MSVNLTSIRINLRITDLKNYDPFNKSVCFLTIGIERVPSAKFCGSLRKISRCLDRVSDSPQKGLRVTRIYVL